jgi:hypothetical protein
VLGELARIFDLFNRCSRPPPVLERFQEKLQTFPVRKRDKTKSRQTTRKPAGTGDSPAAPQGAKTMEAGSSPARE